MMGTRNRTNGEEWDAFSRRARRIIAWRRGEIAKIKRRFRQRTRRKDRQDMKGEARSE